MRQWMSASRCTFTSVSAVALPVPGFPERLLCKCQHCGLARVRAEPRCSPHCGAWTMHTSVTSLHMSTLLHDRCRGSASRRSIRHLDCYLDTCQRCCMAGVGAQLHGGPYGTSVTALQMSTLLRDRCRGSTSRQSMRRWMRASEKTAPGAPPRAGQQCQGLRTEGRKVGRPRRGTGATSPRRSWRMRWLIGERRPGRRSFCWGSSSQVGLSAPTRPIWHSD
jgi:hypothetical protein